MRRILCSLVLALGIGAFGGAPQAKAAAFLWIAGPNWAYAAATCATPGAAFYAWFLSFGAGATANAWTACSGAFGSSASFAIAKAGVGGGGAAFAAGFADPYTGISIDSSLSNSIASEDYSADSTGFSTEFSGQSDFTVGTNGITFNNATGDNLNGLTKLTAYQYNGTVDQSTLCSAFGAGPSCTNGSTSGGDVTDLATLQSDLGGLTPLGTLNNPSNPSTLNFDTPFGSTPSNIILVAQGSADSVPEPASLLLLGPAALALAGIGARRRRR